MQRQLAHQKLTEALILAIAFLLPFVKPVPFFIVALFINWFFEGNFKAKLLMFNENKLLWSYIAFYLLLVTGMIGTDAISSGIFDLEVKLSFLILPIVFGTISTNKKVILKCLNYFVWGCLILTIYLLIYALYKNKRHFYYSDFSQFLHPSYLSMFINVSIAWLILNISEKKYFLVSNFYYSTLLVIYFSFVIVLLSSKAGIVSMLLIHVIMWVRLLNKKRKIYGGVALIIFLTSIIYLFYSESSLIPERLKYSLKVFQSGKFDISSAESNQTRVAILKASENIISNNLIFGVGTGDVKYELIKEYKKQRMIGALEHTYNAHNQFLQTTIALGLIGGIWLILLFVWGIRFAIKNKDLFYLSFLIIFIFNFLFESMLETQAGVMIFVFFNMLFLHREKPNI